MTVMLAGSGGYNRAYMESIRLLLEGFTDVHGKPPLIVIDSMAEEVISISDNIALKQLKSIMPDEPAEVCYDYYGTEHHHYNLTAPTVAFDRVQQRRKALLKQHFVKPAKKAKKRTRRFISIAWR